MPNNIVWVGNAQAVTDIWTITVTAYDAATTYKVGINGKTVTSLAAGSAALAVTDLKNKWLASSEPELREYTPSDASSVLTLTANNPGVPGTPTSAVTGGAGTIGAPSNTQIATGPAFWSNAANWSTGAVPVNTDIVLIDNNKPIYYGLAQSAVTLGSLTIKNKSQVGLTPNNVSGGYSEYRSQYLAISVTTLTLDCTSPCVAIDTGTNACTVICYGTGTATDPTVAPFRLLGAHNSNVLNLFGGNCSVAARPTETATWKTVNMESSGGQSPRLYFGSGVTANNATVAGGLFTSDASLPGTVLCDGGSLTLRGTATAGALTVIHQGSVFTCMSSGTITTLNVASGGQADFTKDIRARTITNTNLYSGAVFDDRYATVTFTNQYKTNECDFPDIKLALGANNRTHAVT